MIKYWKQWRAWVKHEEKERDAAMVRWIVNRIDTVDLAWGSERKADAILDYVRRCDHLFRTW